MVFTRSRRLILYSLLLFIPGSLLLCFLVGRELDYELIAQHREIAHFEELASYRVVNSVGFELFNLHFHFSFKIRELLDVPNTDWPHAVASMVASFQQSDRYVNLLEDVVLVTKPKNGVLEWRELSSGIWNPISDPSWAPSSALVFEPIVDPRVSLELPVMTFPLPPDGRLQRVLLIHYRVQEVLSVIVPGLVKSAFARGNGKYEYSVSVVRQNQLTQTQKTPSVDWVVPIVPDIRFSEWLHTYLDRQADYFPTPEPELHYIQDLTRIHPGAASWALQVKLLPDGLALYSIQWRNRNLFSVASLFAVLWGILGVFLFAVQRVLRAGQRERAFVSLVSHELKTPLAALRALSENLSEGYVKDADRVRDYGTQIVRQTGQLEEMVGNILSLADLKKPQSGLVREPVDVGSLTRRLSGSTGWQLSGPIDEGWTVVGNLAAIEAALDNLVSNAKKYGMAQGAAPEIIVTVGKARRWQSRWVGIAIVDHGVGLATKELRRIRSPFTKGRSATEQQIPGGGLGLSLVRITMKHLGGHLRLQPTSGGGLTATLWLKERPTR